MSSQALIEEEEKKLKLTQETLDSVWTELKEIKQLVQQEELREKYRKVRKMKERKTADSSQWTDKTTESQADINPLECAMVIDPPSDQ